METICDSCGQIIPQGKDRFEIETHGTLCDACYDDYCILCFVDDDEQSEGGLFFL